MTDRRSPLAAGWAVAVLTASAAALWREPGEALVAIIGLGRDLAAPGRFLAGNAWYVLRAAGIAGMLVLASDAVGLRLGRWWLRAPATGPVRCVLPLAGYFTMSAVLLALAALGAWMPGVLLVAAAGLIAASVPDVRRAARDWPAAARESWQALPPAARLPAAGLIALAAFVTAPPETGIDAWAYHLAFPDQLLVTRRLFGTDGYSHWLFPLPLELPGVYALLGGAETAVVWTGLALLGAGATGAARALGAGALSPWLAAGAGLVSGQRWMLLTAKNDAAAAGLMLGAGALLVAGGPLRRRAPRRGVVALAGALLGAAVAAKYVLIPQAAILGLAALWRARPVDRGPVAVLLVAGAAAPLSPWLAKGWCYLADPFYPMGSALLPGIFGDPAADAVRGALLDQHVRDPAHAALVPGMVGRLLAFDLPAALAGWPGALAAFPPGGAALAVAGALASLGAPGLLRGDFATVERYAFPALVLVNLAGAAALVRARSRGPRLALGVLLLAAALRLPGDDAGGRPGAFAAGALGPATYRDGALAPRAGLAAALRALPAGGSGNLLAIGELALWKLPRRARLQVFEPPLAWTASRDAADWRRVAVRFRQSNIRWILYNQPLARIEALNRRPYAWRFEQVRRYADFVVRHVRVAAFCGVAVPGWGSAWLFDVSARPLPPAARIPFLPGAEAAFVSPVLADEYDNPRWAAAWWKGWRGLLPEVSWLDARLGGSLLRLDRPGEAWPLMRRAGADGMVDEFSLPELALAAARTGRRQEALAALRRAEDVLGRGSERLAVANREIMGGR